MFDHITIRVSDRQASERFYEELLGTIGIEKTSTGEAFSEWDDFSIAAAGPGHGVTRRLHIGFSAPSRAAVDEFWSAGMASGYQDDGAPGERPHYAEGYYGAFLLDPDGNSAEAVHYDDVRSDGNVDHVWMRVADVAASKRFYETIAPHVGLRLGTDTDERASFRQTVERAGTFSVVAGEPSEHIHMAFTAADRATVDAFHRAAVDGGYRDNGSPGERPEYHPGYYGAYVLDPDGNNIELVFHDR